MKFLLDVHVGTSIAKALRKEGHDVLQAAFAHQDWSDRRLLDLAVQEQRILVTEDRDFSDLVYAHAAPAPPAILYLRCEPEDQPMMADRVLASLDTDKLQGHMVVIRPGSTRYRPLPGTSKDNG